MSDAPERGQITGSAAAARSGVLVVDKPAGITSHGAVAEVARRLGAVRAGHAGTLDPMATGVLLVCLGDATKIAGLLLADDKAYEGELELGCETDTLDSEGEVVRERRAEAATVDRTALVAAMASVAGRVEQVPPMYSAVRRGGRRLHELARAGHQVERPPRPITVTRFELVTYRPPRARFAVDCSKGTYVRSLIADVGEALACGAHLTALCRTRSGPFGLDRAVPLAQITPEVLLEPGRLVSSARALDHLPQIPLSPAHARAAETGKPMLWNDLSAGPVPSGPVCLIGPDGDLLALVEVETGRIRYRRVLPRRPDGAP